VRKFE
jgi:hypothetical protein